MLTAKSTERVHKGYTDLLLGLVCTILVHHRVSHKVSYKTCVPVIINTIAKCIVTWWPPPEHLLLARGASSAPHACFPLLRGSLNKPLTQHLIQPQPLLGCGFFIYKVPNKANTKRNLHPALSWAQPGTASAGSSSPAPTPFFREHCRRPSPYSFSRSYPSSHALLKCPLTIYSPAAAPARLIGSVQSTCLTQECWTYFNHRGPATLSTHMEVMRRVTYVH